jgi:hypothetical protein
MQILRRDVGEGDVVAGRVGRRVDVELTCGRGLHGDARGDVVDNATPQVIAPKAPARAVGDAQIELVEIFQPDRHSQRPRPRRFRSEG